MPRHPPHALSSLLTSISLTSTRRLTADPVEHELEIEAQTPALRSGLMQHNKYNNSKLNSYSSYALFKERVEPLKRTDKVVELNGFEPMTPGLQSRCSPS